MVEGIKEVYVIKDDNAKGTSCHTQLRQRNLNKEKAARKDNFVITSIGNNDYIVIDGKRYYPNYKNSIRCLNWLILDIDELEKTKSYNFDQKYQTDDMNIISSFDELRSAAKEQYEKNGGLPQLRVIREWQVDEEHSIDGYTIEFDDGTSIFYGEK